MREVSRPDIRGLEVSEVADQTDLLSLADQLVAIAEQLREDGKFGTLSNTNLHSIEIAADPGAIAPCQHGARKNRQAYCQMARDAYTIRRRRESIFGNAELFGEPAWDILLDLYIAHVEEKPVSVSSACIGSASPPTTGLRWLGILAENELVIREHDPDDQRSVLVRLSEAGLAAMDAYFAAATGQQN